ncbi:MAG: hypothetical protein ACI9P3_003519 [Bradyrhizobium sp.]
MLQLNSTDIAKRDYAAGANGRDRIGRRGIGGVHTAYTEPSSIED